MRVRLFDWGRVNVVLTLCSNCLQPFYDDKNYRVVRLPRNPDEPRQKDDDECFICCHRGHDYDIVKIDKTKH